MSTTMNEIITRQRIETITKIKSDHPELSHLFDCISGYNATAELDELIAQLSVLDPKPMPDVTKWAKGMTLVSLVQYIVKYKEQYIEIPRR